MKNVAFKCEVITPLYMAGSDGKTPELRPSEFKGMLRFWWRAIRAENDIKKLREEESKIFGGTGEKEGRSNVRLKVVYDNEKFNKYIGKNLKQDYGFKWDYNKTTNIVTGGHAGIGYILYSTVLTNREREYIKNNFNFDIIISAFDEESYKNALAVFWTAVYLGGFGTRARRVGGNIALNSMEGNTYELDFIPKAKNEQELGNWINENLSKIKSTILSGKTTKYSNLSGAKILI